MEKDVANCLFFFYNIFMIGRPYQIEKRGENMGKLRKIAFLLVVGLGIFMPMVNVDAKESVKVASKEELKAAVAAANSGDVIELTADIKLDSIDDAIVVSGKEVTIDGAGFTITGWRDDEVLKPSGNQSIIVAQQAGAIIHLKNIKLVNSQKYGVQAYDNGYVDLDNVEINNCRYGAVLVNAGTVEIINLKLGTNGESANSGIEVSKAVTITNPDSVPSIVMNGTITSASKDNVIRFADDDNDATTGFIIENKEASVDKILVNDKTVVITDKNNEIKFVSNELKDGTAIKGDDYVPNNGGDNNTTPEVPAGEDNPETADPLLLIIVTLITASVVGGFTFKALKSRA